jgi:hypothetical protein
MPGESTPLEPSVLDWLKSLVRGRPLSIPASPEFAVPDFVEARPAPEARSLPGARITTRQLRLLAIPALFLLVQSGLSASSREPTPWAWVIGLIVAGEVLLWSLLRGDLPVGEAAADGGWRREAPVRGRYLAAGAVLSLLTFLLSSNNTFHLTTVIAWVGSITCLMIAFWDGDASWHRGWDRAIGWLRRPNLRLSLDGWALAFWLLLGVAAVFRFYQLDRLPLDMWSDHAEKLMDVMDLLAGQSSIFFLRNTGREPLQFYLAAATLRALGTGLSFLTLKLGTAFLGWLTLPFVYLFAREYGGRRVALAALFLAGIAFWPNLLGRTGLRFTLLPFFAAYPVLPGSGCTSSDATTSCCPACSLAWVSTATARPACCPSCCWPASSFIWLTHRSWAADTDPLWLLTAMIALVVFVPLAHAGLTYPDQFLSRSRRG